MSHHSPLNILILGASYGSLLAIKLLAAGHNVTLTCRSQTAKLIRDNGIHVRIAHRRAQAVLGSGFLPLHSRTLAAHIQNNQAQMTDGGTRIGMLDARTPQEIDTLGAFDLVVLAMQEPQYQQSGVRELMQGIAAAKLPCMPIMNMPPLPYLKRLSAAAPKSLDLAACRSAYADASVWDGFDADVMTLSSPDPQAFRPPEEPANVLQVGLSSNFKVAPFAKPEHTQILQQLEADIEAVRYCTNPESGSDEWLDIPVKLKVFDSLFVPLAKWSMLLAGNYRCIQAQGMRSIKEAVTADLSQSQHIYDWVVNVITRMGGKADDTVAFNKYAAAAQSLLKPSSSARAIAAGSTQIERVDRLVQAIAAQLGLSHSTLNETVSVVDNWLAHNRQVQHTAIAA